MAQWAALLHARDKDQTTNQLFLHLYFFVKRGKKEQNKNGTVNTKKPLGRKEGRQK